MSDPIIKVKKIRNRWHARLLHGEKVVDEMACELKQDINWICRELLRWESKLGGDSKFADVGRHKQNKGKPDGKVWYNLVLQEEKKARQDARKTVGV